MENDIGRQYVSNYCPKSKKLNLRPPKPLNIDIGQSLLSNGTIESPKKNGARATLLLSNLAKFDQKKKRRKKERIMPYQVPLTADFSLSKFDIFKSFL